MLQALLQLESLDENTFQTNVHQQNFRHHLFGGQVVGQALVAAMRTVENKLPHSLHAYFLRPGNTSQPITYSVERSRDGRSVSNRMVQAIQNGELIYQMMCSFHSNEEGFHHQADYPSGSIAPETLLQQSGHGFTPDSQGIGECNGLSPIDYVAYSGALYDTNAQTQQEARIWIKARQALNNTEEHFGALAFTSDIGLLATTLLPHPTSLFAGDVTPASMDHTIWFHQTPKFDQWHQFITHSPWADNARGLCLGYMYDQQGSLVATVGQEGLIRPQTSTLE